MVLVDPKQVELTHYDSIPHLLTPVITSPRQAATALQNLVREMEQRYSQMALARTRTLKDLNKVRARPRRAAAAVHPVRDRRARGPDDGRARRRRGLDHPHRPEGARGRDPFGFGHPEPARGRHHGHDQGQRAVADRVRGVLADRLARDPRPERRRVAAGHGRHALLAGRLLAPAAHPGRVHRRGADRGADRRLARQGEPELREDLLEEVEAEEVEASGADDGFDPDEDPLLADAIRLVAEMQTASTSMLQRRLRLGYTRAGRLIDMLERRGVISGYEGSKPRQVLVTEADLPRVLAALAAIPQRCPTTT